MPDVAPVNFSLEAAAARGAACMALASPDPGEGLLAAMSLSPRLRTLLDESAGLFEGHSVGAHHAMTLAQQRKYRLGERFPNPDGPDSPHIGERGIVAVLATHDLAKHVPGEKKDKLAEHRRTVAVLDEIRGLFPFSDPQMALIRDLIANNTLGDLLRGVVVRVPPIEEKKWVMHWTRMHGLDDRQYAAIVDGWERYTREELRTPREVEERNNTAAESFKKRAAALGISAAQLLQYQTVMFQCDITAYTFDAFARGVQGTPSLDYIFLRRESAPDGRWFVKHETEDRLRFSPMFEEIYQRLKSKVER